MRHRLPDAEPLVAEKEECPILLQRTSQRSAKLILPVGWFPGRIEGITGIENIVANKIVYVAVKQVLAELRHRADRCRCFSTKLRRVDGLLNIEFLDRIDRRGRGQMVEILV